MNDWCAAQKRWELQGEVSFGEASRNPNCPICIGVLLSWLHDSSSGKQNTLAFLDRSLSIAVSMLKRGES